MAVDLARYVVSLEAQTAKYVQELDKANRKLDSFHKGQQRAVAKIKSAFLSLGVTLASALSVRAIVNFTKASIQAVDQLGETARAAGVSAENLQRLRFALDQLGGIAGGDTDQGLQRFNRTLGLAINGSRQAAEQFRLLGVSVKDSLGRGRGTDETLEAVLRSLGEIENDAQRAAIASRLFGQEMGPKLAAALKGGSQALDEARKQVVGVVSDETVRKAEALDDMFKKMAATIGGTLKEAAIDATFEISKLLGFVEDTPQDILNAKISETEERIAQLTEAIRVNQQQTREGLLGRFGAPGFDRQLGMLQQQLLEARMNLVAFQAAAAPAGQVVVTEVIDPINDGLSEIVVSLGKMPAGWQTFDFAAAQARVLDGLLKEIQVTVKEMPAGLEKLSPEFHEFVAALGRYDAALSEADKKQKQLAESMGRAFEDSFADWILGVEQSFGDLLKRMAAQMIASGIFKAISSMFAGKTGGAAGFFSSFFGGARAEGGPVARGRGYLVGERGPELFMPGMSGSIIPAGGGGVTISLTQHNDLRGSSGDEARAALAVSNARLKQELKAEISDLMRRRRFAT